MIFNQQFTANVWCMIEIFFMYHHVFKLYTLYWGSTIYDVVSKKSIQFPRKNSFKILGIFKSSCYELAKHFISRMPRDSHFKQQFILKMS